MMRKALVASIGMAAMLALAACSGDDKVSRSEYDAAGADRDAALAEAQADHKAARDDLEEADDDYQRAKAAAEAAQDAADAAERAFEGGQIGLVQLEGARARTPPGPPRTGKRRSFRNSPN